MATTYAYERFPFHEPGSGPDSHFTTPESSVIRNSTAYESHHNDGLQRSSMGKCLLQWFWSTLMIDGPSTQDSQAKSSDLRHGKNHAQKRKGSTFTTQETSTAEQSRDDTDEENPAYNVIAREYLLRTSGEIHLDPGTCMQRRLDLSPDIHDSFSEKGAIGVPEQNGDRQDDSFRLYASPFSSPLPRSSMPRHDLPRAHDTPQTINYMKKSFVAVRLTSSASIRITTEEERSLHVAVGALLQTHTRVTPRSDHKYKMEVEYTRLAETIRQKANAHSKKRFLVAIAGIPGSGKTTTAAAVARLLNTSSPKRTTLLSMDGFHLSRATLDRLPNREEAYIRRGAPWTFDAARFVQFIRRLRNWADSTPCASAETIYAPSFDHEAKDPVENGIAITDDAEIVIIEGNYLLLDEPEWREVAALVDYRVFVESDLQVARERVARRHVLAGIEKTLADAFRRVDSNDYLNAVTIREKLIAPDLVVHSVTEPTC
ncbi:putative uridine kinase C227.14 [Aspergillus lentulus]|nr:putative uridine kinase C227.14 [Aspergillus lentulus]